MAVPVTPQQANGAGIEVTGRIGGSLPGGSPRRGRVNLHQLPLPLTPQEAPAARSRAIRTPRQKQHG